MSRFTHLNRKITSTGKFTVHSPALGAVTMQHLNVGNGKFVNSNLSGPLEPSTASITVDAAVDPEGNGSVLTLGEVTLVEGIHWAVDVANVNKTAANLATAINNLSGFSASAVGAEISIEGDTGVPNIAFKVVANTNNLTLAPETGTMTNGSPSIAAPSS